MGDGCRVSGAREGADFGMSEVGGGGVSGGEVVRVKGEVTAGCLLVLGLGFICVVIKPSLIPCWIRTIFYYYIEKRIHSLYIYRY